MQHHVTVGMLVITLMGTAATAEAQGLRSQINDLFTFGDCGQPLCLDLGNQHESHFIPALEQGNFAIIGFLAEAIGKSAANTPISATSSGATFSIVGGLPVRTSTSAGPIFSERSQTLGKGRFFLGANVSGISYTSINGVPLDRITINFPHQDVGEPGLGDPSFENDVVQLRLAMEVELLVASVFATWGILDFVDLGVAVPLVRTSIRGASEAQIHPFGSAAVHTFTSDPTNPVLRAAASIDGSATGIGDVVGRLKINLAQSRRVGAALLTDVRLPTGKEEDLLGSGATSVQALGILAAQFGSFSPHLNAGYLVRTGDLQNDAVLVTAGFDNLMNDWATFAFSLVSEWQVGDSKLALPSEIVFAEPFRREIAAVSIPNRRDNVLNASAGLKLSVRGGMVLVLNGIVPLKRAGMQPDFVWTGGLEYSF